MFVVTVFYFCSFVFISKTKACGFPSFILQDFYSFFFFAMYFQETLTYKGLRKVPKPCEKEFSDFSSRLNFFHVRDFFFCNLEVGIKQTLIRRVRYMVVFFDTQFLLLYIQSGELDRNFLLILLCLLLRQCNMMDKTTERNV